MSESHYAILTRHADGTVTVLHADPVIWVSPELLEQADTWARPSDLLLQLDTAGEYLYRRVGPAPDSRYLEYERVSGDEQFADALALFHEEWRKVREDPEITNLTLGDLRG